MQTMTQRTYWKESLITRQKVYWDIRARELRLKRYLDDILWDLFIEWIDENYLHESKAWLRPDWVDAYLEFENVFDTWHTNRKALTNDYQN
jgi:hypothetical protein